MDPERAQAQAERDQLWASLRPLLPEIERVAAGDFDGSERQAGIVRLAARIVAAELKFREEMGRLQQRLSQRSAEGDAGAGLVKVRVNGRKEVVAVTLGDAALRLDDKEMLEELIRAAVNQALERVRQQAAEEWDKSALALGLPPGLNLPGVLGV